MRKGNEILKQVGVQFNFVIAFIFKHLRYSFHKMLMDDAGLSLSRRFFILFVKPKINLPTFFLSMRTRPHTTLKNIIFCRVTSQFTGFSVGFVWSHWDHSNICFFFILSYYCMTFLTKLATYIRLIFDR